MLPRGTTVGGFGASKESSQHRESVKTHGDEARQTFRHFERMLGSGEAQGGSIRFPCAREQCFWGGFTRRLVLPFAEILTLNLTNYRQFR